MFSAPSGAGLTNADQRITEDVEKFSFAIADLFSYTFKPLLDVILFTRSLSKIMGYKGQARTPLATTLFQPGDCLLPPGESPLHCFSAFFAHSHAQIIVVRCVS